MVGSCCISPPATQVSNETRPDLEILEDGPKGEEESLGDDAQFLGDEDEIRTRQKLNSVATITSLRFQPISSS